MTQAIGKPLNRVDGRLKVTGGAHYAAEIPLENLAYAVAIGSTIARGQIKSIDSQEAEKLPGVLRVITHENAPKLQPVKPFTKGGVVGEKPQPLQEPIVYHSGQHIGVVVANSLELATYAASLVRVIYEEETPIVDKNKVRQEAFEPETIFGKPPNFVRGNPEEGLSSADVRIEETYTTPTENHNPIEPPATIAMWEGDKLTVYDATQHAFGVREALATSFRIPQENVRVICHFIGGAFGCKGPVWPHVILAAIAGHEVGRPVKLVLKRQQMFDVIGHRPETEQHIKLGSTRDGRLTTIIHDGISPTSMFDEYVEAFTVATHVLYACPNLQASQRLIRLNKGTPTFMRAPGEAAGTFALESALDELAYALNLDPIELRLRNYADIDPDTNLPWSSKSLKECYRVGAENFGWSRRNREPRSMRDDGYLIGMGMATATFPANQSPAAIKARILADGSANVQSGTHEMGTGTATVMAQLAADILGLPVKRVRFELGDTEFPPAPVSHGSATVGSVGTALYGAATDVKVKVLEIARNDRNSPLYQVPENEVAIANGRLFIKNNPAKGETYADILARHHLEQVEADYQSLFDTEEKYSKHGFGAHFVEVRVDPDFGEVRITRYTGAFATGRILNQKTARSQFIGAIIMGIGMALMEETITDQSIGRVVNANLGDYHVPVNADIPNIDIHIVDEVDPYVNPIGTKGIGEIGITGAAAAVANAVYHATGKRIRNLPITPDKLI
ncbi:acylaldehyde oxidase [Nostocales cyanobacterium HT-58-2]|nr:acylaldehyde oxidase [Nostocales cyanobacterium HT-58-2]